MKLAQMMQGRYGSDNFYRFLVFLAFVLIIVARITKIGYIDFLVIALLVYATFRMYSKNIFKRQQENIKYLKLTAPLRNKFYAMKYKNEQKKKRENDVNHIYIKCAGCGKEYRVPRNVGTIVATCPNCKARTQVKTNIQ